MIIKKLVDISVTRKGGVDNKTGSVRMIVTLIIRQATYYDRNADNKTDSVRMIVTLRRLCLSIAVEKQEVLHIPSVCVCVCNINCAARNAHAPYCHVCHVPLYNIFPHYLINGTTFGEKVTQHKMCVLIVSAKFV